MPEKIQLLIAPEDGGPEIVLHSLQNANEWISKQHSEWDWVRRENPSTHTFLEQGKRTIQELMGKIDWKSPEELASTGLQINRVINQKRFVRPVGTFGKFAIELQGSNPKTGASALAFYVGQPVEGVSDNNAMRGILAWFAQDQGLPVARQDVADQFGASTKRVDSWLSTKRSELDKVEADYNRIKRTFESYMSLRMPDDYWAKRAVRMHIAAGIWGAAFVASIVGAAMSVVFFISEELLAEVTSDFHPWAAIRALAIGTLGLWLIRFFAKNLYSSLHLATDASERRTMISTYLALEKSGGLTEKDREFILSPLFRPTADGLVKEDGGQPILLDAEKLLKRF